MPSPSNPNPPRPADGRLPDGALGDLDVEADPLELAAARVLGFLRRNRVALAWGVAATALVVVVLTAWMRARERKERDASRAGDQIISVEQARQRLAEFGGTSQAPQLRLVLARMLWQRAQSLDVERPNDPATFDEKLAVLDEAARVLDTHRGDWIRGPLAADVARMAEQVQQQTKWERAHGVRFVKRTVTPKPGKQLGTIAAAPAKPKVAILTEKGQIVIELDEDAAGNVVHNFLALVAEGFYDGLTFHRVEKDAANPLIQGGDPKGDGQGGPGYRMYDGMRSLRAFGAGTVAMANSGANTDGSQFFICTGDLSASTKDAWAGKYSIFGTVVEGLDVAAKVERGEKITEIRILSRRGTDGGPFPYAPIVVWPTPDGPLKK